MNKRYVHAKGCRILVISSDYVEKNPLTVNMKRIIAGVIAGSFLIAAGLTASCYVG